MTTRREFLQASAAILAADWTGPRPGAAGPTGRLPLGFSTLGCPQWTWSQVLDFAAAHGFAAVELRGLQAAMDLTQVPELAPERLGEAKRQLAEHGLRVPCLGSSANMHEMDAAKRAAQLDEARRFIDLARALRAPYVRVFGNKYVAGDARAHRPRLARAGRLRAAAARHRPDRVPRRLHRFTHPARDPPAGGLPGRGAALGRAPHLRVGEGSALGHGAP